VVHEEEGVNLCDKEQKGFIPRRAGCVEHVAVVNALINDAVQNKLPIYVLSLDLKDAFGSVPHELIRRNLNDIGIPENIKSLVIEAYENAYIQIQTKGGCTGRIEIGKGVKQGCPLSPTLFNIGLDPLLRYLRRNFEEFGYKYYEGRDLQTNIAQAYADDLLLFANSKENIDHLIDGVITYMNYAQININPDKCKILVYNRNEEVDPDFTLPDAQGILQALDRVEINEVFRYLGVSVGVRKIAKMKFNNEKN
jgi:hypothetical protein